MSSTKTKDTAIIESFARILSKDRSLLGELDPALINDKQFILSLLHIDGHIYTSASFPNKLRNDEEVIIAAVSQNPSVFHFLRKEWKLNKQIALAILKKEGSHLYKMDKSLRHDRDIVLMALESNPYAMQWASTELNNDLYMVLTALYYSDTNAQYISDELKLHPAVKFALNHLSICKSSDWPIIKRALVEQSDRFLNPPEIITELAGNMDNKYLIYAQHALNEQCSIPNLKLPDLEYGF